MYLQIAHACFRPAVAEVSSHGKAYSSYSLACSRKGLLTARPVDAL